MISVFGDILTLFPLILFGRGLDGVFGIFGIVWSVIVYGAGIAVLFATRF